MAKKKSRGYDPFSNMGFGLGFEEQFERMRKMMEKTFENMMDIDDRRIEKLMKDPNAKVYGWSINIGPEGKPVVREFGNVKPSLEAIEEGKEELIGAREPLTEVQRHGNEIIVIAEIPGVLKEDIKLTAKENELEIKVEKNSRKYFKKLDLPAIVDESSVRANYNNGILEVKMTAKGEKEKKGKAIKVE